MRPRQTYTPHGRRRLVEELQELDLMVEDERGLEVGGRNDDDDEDVVGER